MTCTRLIFHRYIGKGDVLIQFNACIFSVCFYHCLSRNSGRILDFLCQQNSIYICDWYNPLFYFTIISSFDIVLRILNFEDGSIFVPVTLVFSQILCITPYSNIFDFIKHYRLIGYFMYYKNTCLNIIHINNMKLKIHML